MRKQIMVACLLVLVIFIFLALYIENKPYKNYHVQVPEQKQLVVVPGKITAVIHINCNPLNLFEEEMEELDSLYLEACLGIVEDIKKHIETKKSEIGFITSQWVDMHKTIYGERIGSDVETTSEVLTDKMIMEDESF